MEKEVMIVCKDCGRELPESSFKMTRWGKRAQVCNECAGKKIVEAKKQNNAARNQMLRSLRLKDFTPRELMQELARRGYEGELTYTEVHKIDITNF